MENTSYVHPINFLLLESWDMHVLTPKIGIGSRLTCGPSLVRNTIRQEIFLKAFGKDACGREHAIIQQKGCFALGIGSIREYVMTWPEYKEGTN
jgi:hypothetical protein